MSRRAAPEANAGMRSTEGCRPMDAGAVCPPRASRGAPGGIGPASGFDAGAGPAKRRMRGRSWVPVLGALTGAAIAWWWLRPDAPQRAPSAVAIVAPAASAPVSPKAPAARPAVVPASAAPAPTRATAPPPAASAAGPAQVCGFGTVPATTADVGTRALPQEARRAAFQPVDAALRGHADPQVRAAALVIGGSLPADRLDRIDLLARMAGTATDPAIYQLGLQACRTVRRDTPLGACQALTVARWTQLEPDNAVAWITLAREAREQRQPAAEQEAMARAAQATAVRSRASWLPGVVGQAVARQPELGRLLALERAWSLSSAGAGDSGREVAHYCAQAAADAQRRPRCDALVELLWSQGDTLADATLAARVARSLQWPAERLQRMEEELAALRAVGRLHARALYGSAPADCGALQRLQAWTAAVGAQGEVPALRAEMARSGRGVREWSEEYRRGSAAAAASRAAATRR